MAAWLLRNHAVGEHRPQDGTPRRPARFARLVGRLAGGSAVAALCPDYAVGTMGWQAGRARDVQAGHCSAKHVPSTIRR